MCVVILNGEKMTPPYREYLLDTKMVLSYGVTKHDTLQNQIKNRKDR